MQTRRQLMTTAAGAALLAAGSVAASLGGAAERAAAREMADEPIKVIATFSILADLVRNVGGDRVDVAALVGPNGNAHVYSPSPADARKVAEARLVFVNGLGFEGWLERLVKASGTSAPIIVASKGVQPLERAAREHEHDHDHDHDHDHHHGGADPHAWQSVANAKVYVRNIRDALIAIDPEAKSRYEANVAAYLAQLDGLEQEVRSTIAKIPADRRRVVSSHRAFGYFENAYGIVFTAPQGVSTESEASARDVAAIITAVRQHKAAAVFVENVTDPRLVQQIASETGVKVGGVLYSDALTDANGGAPTYVGLIRHNLRQLAGALTS
jgi:zinc/manganese transport system substrate-binding protein